MNLIPVYSTPIWETPFPDFKNQKELFTTAVREFRENNPDTNQRTSLGNGYESPINLTKEPRLADLYEYIAQIGLKAAFDMQLVDVNVYISAAWVNFNDSRSVSKFEHVHQDTFSGVFYLKVPEKSGNLVLINPGMNSLWQGSMLVDQKNKFNADRMRIEPIEGHIFVWPSYLPHAVEPNDHDDERISISFNIICLPKGYINHTK